MGSAADRAASAMARMRVTSKRTVMARVGCEGGRVYGGGGEE